MSKKIGVIAEDNSDVEVVKAILAKYLNKNDFQVKKFVGNGCGKLRNKCASWASLLVKQGCEHVLLFHDLDRWCENELRKELEGKLKSKGIPNSIVIVPVEEMEAWLLSDCEAIKRVFNLKAKPKAISMCEDIKSPKEHLRDIVWKQGKKKYLNTIHNQKIASLASLNDLLRCPSYRVLHDYIESRVNA